MRIFVVSFLGLFLYSCGNHHPAPVRDGLQSKKTNSSHPLSKQHKFNAKYVHVKRGDTLYSLGFSHDIDFKTLAKINNIRSPYHIYPGQRLKLKKGSSSQSKTTITKQSKPVIKPASKTTSKVTTKPQVLVVNVNKPKINPIKKPVIRKAPKENKNNPQVLAPAANSRWIWPVQGKIISTFSVSDTSRKGIDISSSHGSDVYASNNGSVVYSGDGLRGYGELIIIKHSNNLLSAYAHNSKRLAKEGQSVNQGQVIAKTGKGTDGKPLLHFEIRKNGKPVNPLTYLPKK